MSTNIFNLDESNKHNYNTLTTSLADYTPSTTSHCYVPQASHPKFRTATNFATKLRAAAKFATTFRIQTSHCYELRIATSFAPLRTSHAKLRIVRNLRTLRELRNGANESTKPSFKS